MMRLKVSGLADRLVLVILDSQYSDVNKLPTESHERVALPTAHTSFCQDLLSFVLSFLFPPHPSPLISHDLILGSTHHSGVIIEHHSHYHSHQFATPVTCVGA